MVNRFTEEDIRSKAYELWERAGCPDGGAEIYWAQAEMILSGTHEVQAPESAETGLPAQQIPDEE